MKTYKVEKTKKLKPGDPVRVVEFQGRAMVEFCHIKHADGIVQEVYFDKDTRRYWTTWTPMKYLRRTKDDSTRSNPDS